MHEAGHNTLFTDRRLNQWVGQWLCALPTLNDLNAYATGHLDHHRLAGTPKILIWPTTEPILLIQRVFDAR